MNWVLQHRQGVCRRPCARHLICFFSFFLCVCVLYIHVCAHSHVYVWMHVCPGGCQHVCLMVWKLRWHGGGFFDCWSSHSFTAEPELFSLICVLLASLPWSPLCLPSETDQTVHPPGIRHFLGLLDKHFAHYVISSGPHMKRSTLRNLYRQCS